jgi:hypothetical protein
VAIPVPLLARFESQLDALALVLGRATPGARETRPPSGDWSARENLAHLARHHAVFLERLQRLLAEPASALGRYRLRFDFNLLDLTPLGRQETWEDSPKGWPQTPPYQWWRLHDEFDARDR